jgi:hypothetical protein
LQAAALNEGNGTSQHDPLSEPLPPRLRQELLPKQTVSDRYLKRPATEHVPRLPARLPYPERLSIPLE